MFHLPTADHRMELMGIYAEALSQFSEIPVRQGGVELDTELSHIRPSIQNLLPTGHESPQQILRPNFS